MATKQAPQFQPLPTENNPDGFDPIEYYQHGGDNLPSTFLESAYAQMGLTWEDTLGSVIKQQRELKAAQQAGGDLIDPAVLNDRFPYMEQPFTKATSENVAQLLADRQRERIRLENEVAHGPQGIAYSGGRFAAGMIASLMDPVELGANIASGMALGSVGRAARIGFLMAEEPTILQTAARGAAEAFAGNVATEPFRYANAVSNQRQYSLRDAAQNAIVSSIGFGATLGFGAWAVRGLSKASRYLRGMSPELEEAAAESSIGAVANDRRPMVNEMIDATARRFEPPEFTGRSEHAYVPIEDGRQIELVGNRLYGSTPEKRTEYFAGPRGYLEENYGSHGTYLTDSKDVANNLAFNSSKVQFGSVFDFNVNSKDLKLLNLEAKPEGRVKEILEGFINAVMPEDRAKRLLAKGTVRDIYDAIYSMGKKGILSDAVDQLNAKFAAEGYHGLRFEGGATAKSAKIAPTRHNVVMFFDHMDTGEAVPRISQAAVSEPDIRQAPSGLTHEQARNLAERAHSIHNHALFDDADYSDLQEHLTIGDPKPQTLPDIKNETKEFMNRIRLKEAQGAVDGSVKEEIEKIVQKASEENIDDAIAQNALACMSGGLE